MKEFKLYECLVNNINDEINISILSSRIHDLPDKNLEIFLSLIYHYYIINSKNKEKAISTIEKLLNEY